MYKFLIYVFCFSLWTFVTYAEPNQDCELIIQGHCKSCNSLESFEVSSIETCKALCPNRKNFYPWRMIYCALEECPKDYPVRDEEYGHCSTEKINERNILEEEFKEIDIATEQYGVKASGNECPPDKPLFDNHWCLPCDYPFDVSSTKENAKHCPNRISIPYPWSNNDYTETYLPCPEDKPLRSWYGKCYSCDYPDVIHVITQCLEDDKICDVCPNRIILPRNGGNRSSILKCPSDRPLMDSSGICFSCDVNIPIETARKNDCEKFCSSQRKQIEGACVKSGS